MKDEEGIEEGVQSLALDEIAEEEDAERLAFCARDNFTFRDRLAKPVRRRICNDAGFTTLYYSIHCSLRSFRIEDEPVHVLEIFFFHDPIKVILPFRAGFGTAQMMDEGDDGVGMTPRVCREKRGVVEFVLEEEVKLGRSADFGPLGDDDPAD